MYFINFGLLLKLIILLKIILYLLYKIIYKDTLYSFKLFNKLNNKNIFI